MQALQHATELRQIELHQEEKGIALLSAIYVNSKRDLKKHKPAKVEDFYHYQPKSDRIIIPASAVEIFFALVTENKLPYWAMDIAPIDELRANRIQGTKTPHVRAWVGNGVLLIEPAIYGGQVCSELAFVDTEKPYHRLVDVDTAIEHQIRIPTTGALWVLDFEGDVVDL